MKNSGVVFLVLIMAAVLPGSVAAQAPRAGEVTALLPAAHVERGGAPATEIRVHDPVFWQDWLETEARARARLVLLDGSILNVGSEARLQVVRHEQATQQTELELEFGKVRAEIQKIGRPGGRFEVRTETAVIGVIGTHVYIDSAGELSTVINFEGSVRVRNADRSVPGEEVLEPFELAEIERGRRPRKRLATLEELLRAMEDTLPGLLTRLVPQRARVGSCQSATSGDSFADPEAGGALADFPFLEVFARPCAFPGLTPLRVCVPETARPGVYEYAVTAADGTRRWGAFLVQPREPLQDARLLTSPQLPPGATHTGRVVGKDDQPLAGVPIRVRKDGGEEIIYTDEEGGFTVQAPESGKLELELVRGAGEAAASPLAEPLPPIRVAIPVVDKLEADSELPEFSQRGTVVNVPGELRSARLGERPLPVLRTATRAGQTVSTIAIPPDMPEGPSPLELEDAGGNRRTHPLLVYEILAARLDQRLLMSGAATQGEFLVCVGRTEGKQKVRARILAVGPVRFRGKGGKGKRFERTFKVESSGLLRIPFEIQAEKGAPGPGLPFSLTLHLRSD